MRMRRNKWLITIGCCIVTSLFVGIVLAQAADGIQAIPARQQSDSPKEAMSDRHPASSTDANEVHERGITDKLKGKAFDSRLQTQPSGSPPPQLCHTETRMMTQCKCFNQAECQALTALFPGSCPAGSQHCEFVPMSRGAMPSLPPNLCGYQVPFSSTECSCQNVADCQLLSPFCPGSCPAGSQSCTCRPVRRGN
jgi:hypothetical protein